VLFTSANELAKLANALEATTDYLMNGTSGNQANNSFTDKELLNTFKLIEKLTEQDKSLEKYFWMLLLPKANLNS
jgi:hypothetical protein